MSQITSQKLKWSVRKRKKSNGQTLRSPLNVHETSIDFFQYNEAHLTEEKNATAKSLFELNVSDERVLWINVDGLKNNEIIENLAKHFMLHPLAVEDVKHAYQRPKVESYNHHLFITTRLFTYDDELKVEQMSFFLFKNLLITFQETPGDCFGSIRKRLRENQGQIRSKPIDYLLYELLDSVVDSYFPIIDHLGEKLEDLETKILKEPHKEHVFEIYNMKSNLLRLRRAVWPMRDAMTSLHKEGEVFLRHQNKHYFRDVSDHCTQLIDLIENFREMSTSLLEVYLSTISNRLNEVMKVLTMIATIFIPLSFITGIYGMNFDTNISPWNMPELEWAYGYPFALGLMAIIFFIMVYYFYKKGWFR